ncbi:MAG: hypothetical protein FWD65_08145, partial [Coriobacteriia bacterium]|nr:hypothetical protein [Coriobacteriia bacterium]
AAPTGSMWSLIDGAGFAGSSTAVSNPASVTTWADATGTVKLLSPVSFTATQVEGTSGVSNSLGIQITFNKAVSGLTASDIKLIDATIFFYDYTGAATTGTLTGSGTTWVISLTRVASEGTADVLITDFGQYHIINNPQSIMVYKDSNIAHLPAAAAIANQVYTGAALKPVPVIKDGSKTLVNGSDFTLAYASNTAVGTATITVTGIGAYSGTTTVSFKIVPATPALASLANSTTGPLLKWNKAAGATGYYVLRKTGTGSWASIKKITAAATVSYTDTTAVSGTAYSYSVQAYGGASSLAGSYNTTGKTITYVATPKLTSAVNVTTGVKFTWGKVSGATGYLIYRKTGTGAWVKVKTITSAATVAWTDTAVKSGTTYTYTAYAYKTSSANKSACNATGKKVVYVATPKLVSLANSKSGPVFKWGKVTGATGYIVLRKTTGGWSTIATIKSGSTVSYTDKKAAKGKTYSYTVRAYKTSTANISAYNATGKKIKVKK